MPEVFNAGENPEHHKRGRQKNHPVSLNSGNYMNLKPQGESAFSSFMVWPKKMSFQTQDQQEKIVLLLRQHPIVNLGWITILALMLFAPSLMEFVPGFEVLPARFQFMTVILWYLLTLAYALENFLNWYFNVYIVTDERIVDIDFYGLIYSDLSVTKTANIQDVNFKRMGSLSALFDFGNVNIQTAGENREFEFGNVPHPAKVVEIIYKLLEEEERESLEGRVK